MNEFKVMVPGASAADVVEITSPYDGSVVGSVERIDEEGADRALNNASELFNDRSRWLPVHERVEVLEKTAELMQAQFDELVNLALSEGGKPFTDSQVEVARAIDGMKNCIECVRSEHGTEIPMGINPASSNRLAMTSKEPIGPVMAVSAFNHPLNLIIHQVGPAVASGCPVIVKPASDTALSCFKFVELLREAGLPAEYAQAVAVTSNVTATNMVTDPRIAFFSFIGSGKVGWMLKSKLAPGTRCALEHGGAAPVIVAEDADLGAMLPLLAKGSFYHAGQVCVSVQRIFVNSKVLEEFLDKFTPIVSDLKVGDPLIESTDLGPLIRNSEVERVDKWVKESIDNGSKLLLGGKKINNTAYDKTILLNPNHNDIISKNEIFGPVVCIYPYEKFESAIEVANSVNASFQSSIFTNNVNELLKFYQKINASAVFHNDHTAFRVDWMPFSGLKESGHGVGGIKYTMHEMQIDKMLVLRN